MKSTQLALAGILAASLSAHAQTVLSTEHVDIGVNYEDGAWDLHIHDETNDAEYAPGDAILQVNGAAQTTVSSNPLFNFLGAPGSDLWLLPNTQTPGLLFLGFGAEEMQSAVFDFNPVGEPQVLMNSADGFSANDVFNGVPGSHSDVNWVFSAPGVYTVSFEASGTLADGNAFTRSGPVSYTFQVVPEPGTWALMGLGLAGLLGTQARRRRTVSMRANN
jgi:surface-anchored protein